MAIMHGDLLFLSLLPFLECTSSSETSLRTDIFFFSSLSEFLTRDRANRFSNFLVNLTIFSSYSLMRASFSLLSLTSFSSVSFMAAIFLFQLFVAIVLTRKLVSVTAKRVTIVVAFHFTESRLKLSGALGSFCPIRHFLLRVLWFGWRCCHLSNDNHPWSLCHTSCFHSMHSPFRDDASLVGSSGERSVILLRSLRDDITHGHAPLKNMLLGHESLDFWRKRWEVEMSYRTCQNL